MLSAPLPTPRSLTTRTARMTVLAVVGAGVLTALPVTSSAVPEPHAVTPSVTERELSALRTLAPDTVEVGGRAPLVALTWPADAAPPAESPVHVRVRTESGGWGPWQATSVNTTKDPVSTGLQRVGTDPVWVGTEVRATQIRVPRTSEGAGAVNRGLVELIDPGRSDADAVDSAPAVSAQAVAARPSIISRDGWGADESLRTCRPSYGETLRGVFVHHTAGTNNYSSSQSAALVRGIYAYHTQSLGWCDIGYNVLVDRYGQDFEGRAGGLDRAVTGAHALGFNTDTWGVSVLGNYSTVTPTSASMSALARVIAWRSSTFYHWPLSTTTLTSADSGSRYPKGTRVALPFISGHPDTNTRR